MATQIEHELEEVEGARAGEREAFDRLARHYRTLLLAMAFLRTSDREEAEDLVQEVLARAWEKLPALEQPGAFAGWLQRIMRNACCNWSRGRQHQPLSLEDCQPTSQPALDPPAVMLARERQWVLRAALLALAPDNRLALLMHLWGEYSYEEIGRLLDVPVSTVDGRIYRAKQQLRRILREQDTDLLNEPRRKWGEKGRKS